eukprot:5624480-Prymnesium_polylepis.1
MSSAPADEAGRGGPMTGAPCAAARRAREIDHKALGAWGWWAAASSAPGCGGRAGAWLGRRARWA